MHGRKDGCLRNPRQATAEISPMGENGPASERCPICKDEECNVHLLARFDAFGDEDALGVGMRSLGPQPFRMNVLPPNSRHAVAPQQTTLGAKSDQSAAQQSVQLFNLLVRAGEQGRWHVRVLGFGCLQVGVEIEFGRQLYRQGRPVLTLEDTAGMLADRPPL